MLSQSRSRLRFYGNHTKDICLARCFYKRAPQIPPGTSTGAASICFSASVGQRPNRIAKLTSDSGFSVRPVALLAVRRVVAQRPAAGRAVHARPGGARRQRPDPRPLQGLPQQSDQRADDRAQAAAQRRYGRSRATCRRAGALTPRGLNLISCLRVHRRD